MKKLLLALALILAPTLASAQCTGVFPSNTLCGNFSGSPAPPRAVTSGNQVSGTGNNLLNNSGLGLTTNISTVLVGNPIPISGFTTTSANSNVARFTTTGTAGLKPGKLVAIFGPTQAILNLTGINVTGGTTISNAPPGTFTQSVGDLIWNKGGTNHTSRTQFRITSVAVDGTSVAFGGGLTNETNVTFNLETIQGGYAVDPTVNGMPQAGNPIAPAFYYYPLQVTSTGVNTFNATMAGRDANAGTSSAAIAYEVTNGTQGTSLTVGPDWWTVSNSLSWYKMRGYDWDGTTVVNKPGSLYSVKAVKGLTSSELFFYDLTAQNPATSNITTNYAGAANFQGRTITCGAYLWSPTALQGRLFINDGGASTFSSFITPGSYKWVEVSKSISPTAASALFGFTTDTGLVGDVFFFTQPICLFGNLPIGEGNYRPAPASLKMFQAHINPFYYVGRPVLAPTFIHLEQETCGLLPTGMQSIQSDVEAYNDTELSYLYLADNNTAPQMSALTLYNQVVGGGVKNVNSQVVAVGRQATGDGNFFSDYHFLFVNDAHFVATIDYTAGVYQ